MPYLLSFNRFGDSDLLPNRRREHNMVEIVKGPAGRGRTATA